MDWYKDATYGERIAGTYDAFYAEVDPACVDLLAELAGGGAALELGIGTGRVALPLHARGIPVHGIDASAAMVAQLQAKAGETEIGVTVGSFAEFDLPERYQLIYVVFNTFFALLTQEEQIRCFHAVARHLAPAGVFLMEVFIPDLTRFQGNQAIRIVSMDESSVRLDLTQHEPLTQRISAQGVVLDEGGLQFFPVKLRYAWPSELDLMARLAGLSLQQRWASWSKEPLRAGSQRHISVYGR